MTRESFRSSRGGVLLVVALSYAAVGLSSGALPIAVAERGGDASAVGLAMGAYAFTTVLARLVCGAWMERWGHRRCLVAAALLLAVGQAASTGAGAVLVLARLVVGLGIGTLLAAGTGWLVELPAAQGRMGHTLGSIGTVNYTVLALGAPVGAWLARTSGAREALWLAVAPPLLAVPLLLWLRSPARSSSGSSAGPRAGGLVHVLGLGLALAAVGNPVVVAFGVRQGAAHHVAGSGAAVLVYGLSLVGARIVLASFTERMSTPGATVALFGLEAAGIALLAVTRHPVLFLLASATIGTAMAFTYPVTGSQLAARVAAGRGRALSVLGAYVNLGIGLGAILVGWAATLTSPTSALLGAAAATVAAGLIIGRALHPAP